MRRPSVSSIHVLPKLRGMATTMKTKDSQLICSRETLRKEAAWVATGAKVSHNFEEKATESVSCVHVFPNEFSLFFTLLGTFLSSQVFSGSSKKQGVYEWRPALPLPVKPRSTRPTVALTLKINLRLLLYYLNALFLTLPGWEKEPMRSGLNAYTLDIVTFILSPLAGSELWGHGYKDWKIVSFRGLWKPWCAHQTFHTSH